MAQLIVRKLDADVVAALRARAARAGRSMEAEHRQILIAALQPGRSRSTLKQWLARMPNVGIDRDFSRIRRRPRSIRL